MSIHESGRSKGQCSPYMPKYRIVNFIRFFLVQNYCFKMYIHCFIHTCYAISYVHVFYTYCVSRKESSLTHCLLCMMSDSWITFDDDLDCWIDLDGQLREIHWSLILTSKFFSRFCLELKPKIFSTNDLCD